MINSAHLHRSAVALSGPYAKLNRDCDGRLYGSYHWPSFTFTEAQRNTLQRFREFRCPVDCSHRSVYDFGTGLGALALEAARRRASNVVGFEYRLDRVIVANLIAAFLDVEDRVRFFQLDLEPVVGSAEKVAEFTQQLPPRDVVVCCSLDAYVDPFGLYQLLAAVTAEVCYFESNQPAVSTDALVDKMAQLGFRTISDLGDSKSDRWERRIFRLDKRRLLAERRLPNNPWNHGTYRQGQEVVSDFESLDHWRHMASLYERIKHIPQVVEMDFTLPHRVRRRWFEHCLGKMNLTADERQALKLQMIDFLRSLNAAGVAHRDLHVGNIYVEGGQIRVCDWEYIAENPVPLAEAYDITGDGLPSPLNTSNMNVFHDWPCSLARVLDVRPEELLEEYPHR